MENQSGESENPAISPVSRRVAKLLESRPENDKVFEVDSQQQLTSTGYMIVQQIISV